MQLGFVSFEGTKKDYFYTDTDWIPVISKYSTYIINRNKHNTTLFLY